MQFRWFWIYCLNEANTAFKNPVRHPGVFPWYAFRKQQGNDSQYWTDRCDCKYLITAQELLVADRKFFFVFVLNTLGNGISGFLTVVSLTLISLVNQILYCASLLSNPVS